MIFNMIAQGGGSGGSEISFEPHLDGKNHYTFLITDVNDSTVQMYPINSTTIDWGDGTVESVRAGKYLHTYNATGIFDVSFSGRAPVWSNQYYIDYQYRGKLIYAEIHNANGDRGLQGAYGLYHAYICSDNGFPDYICSEDGALVSCVLENGITTVGTEAFRYCYSLSDISLPDTITTIKTLAFETCRSLLKVTIPSAVTSIEDYAFRYCISLTEVHIKATTPPTAGKSIFPNYHETIYVPSGSLSAYQSASNWSTYSSRMVEE